VVQGIAAVALLAISVRQVSPRGAPSEDEIPIVAEVPLVAQPPPEPVRTGGSR